MPAIHSNVCHLRLKCGETFAAEPFSGPTHLVKKGKGACGLKQTCFYTAGGLIGVKCLEDNVSKRLFKIASQSNAILRCSTDRVPDHSETSPQYSSANLNILGEGLCFLATERGNEFHDAILGRIHYKPK
ncbi:hypothetical protein ACO22_00145 [Paracoccidioides brasiliensis]|uniref:Uncharacterized protein n=1 Tax=Paracoccidioides brasiliensis TaxID=121759 RepID=A0A1D2JQE2_PARBR|nr:hypothetical protein ACO22_00145 [Paracoccidioides brasiliensis]